MEKEKLEVGKKKQSQKNYQKKIKTKTFLNKKSKTKLL
jgi:hypothetical protein